MTKAAEMVKILVSGFINGFCTLGRIVKVASVGAESA